MSRIENGFAHVKVERYGLNRVAENNTSSTK